ncbi:MAG: SOS response-associated peptidase [Planctomycetota bacterium]
MCGRYVNGPMTYAFWSELNRFLDALGMNYNVAPTAKVPILRATDGRREPAAVRWGLIPSWAKDEKIGYRTINARAETVRAKPAFRSAFKRRRCIVLADGYYEWTGPKGNKQPYYVHRVDERPLAFYGLWEQWGDVESCTIITTETNSQLAHLHPRMPCITEVESPNIDLWLDPAFEDYKHLHATLKPTADDLLQTRKVSKYVNKVTNNGPECLAPI